MKKLFFVLSLLFVALSVFARDYGLEPEVSKYRFRVKAKSYITIRKSPSKKATALGKAYKGDYIYCNSPEIIPKEGSDWLCFYQHDEHEYHYVLASYLTQEENPFYVEPDTHDKDKDSPFNISWMPTLFFILFALNSILFVIYRARKKYKKYSYTGEPWSHIFFLGLRRENGLRKMWVFNKNPYQTLLEFFGTVVGAFVFTFLALLVIGTIILCVYYVLGGLLWVLIILGWILLVGCGLAVFSGLIFALIGVFIGIWIVSSAGTLSETASYLFSKGVLMLQSFNVWDLCVNIVTEYWLIILLVVTAPIILFLVVAVLWLLLAGLVSMYESIVMARYNVKHPCPICGKPSEPARYVIGRDPSTGERMYLPVPLRPGVYGIFSITIPDTGQKLPTLFLNGKDKLERQCPHCSSIVKADVGQEKHVAFAGVAQSGKTTLLYRIIAELMRTYKAKITDNMGVEHVAIEKFIKSIRGGEEIVDYPPKTAENRHRSIQMMLGHDGASIPYKLYLNDLAGEMFTATNNRVSDAPFFRNTNVILFIVDPMTMRSSDLDFGANFASWYSQNVGNKADNAGKVDLDMALNVLKNTIEHHRKSKSIHDVSLMVVLVKADSGYLGNINTSDSKAIRGFVDQEMGLGRFLYTAETSFSDVSYYAVSAKTQANNRMSGMKFFLQSLLKKLKLDVKVS